MKKNWILAWRTMSGEVVERVMESNDPLEVGSAYGQLLLDLMGEAYCHGREDLRELVVIEGDRAIMSGGWYEPAMV